MIRKLFVIIVILIVLAFASTSFAVPTLSLSPTGNSAFAIRGLDLTGVAGLDLTLTYDAAILAAPHAVRGPLLSGAMVAVNPNSPGLLRISAVTLSPLKGSGLLFSIAFTRKRGGQGIRQLSVRLIDRNGKTLAAKVRVRIDRGAGISYEHRK